MNLLKKFNCSTTSILNKISSKVNACITPVTQTVQNLPPIPQPELGSNPAELLKMLLNTQKNEPNLK